MFDTLAYLFCLILFTDSLEIGGLPSLLWSKSNVYCKLFGFEVLRKIKLLVGFFSIKSTDIIFFLLFDKTDFSAGESAASFVLVSLKTLSSWVMDFESLNSWIVKATVPLLRVLNILLFQNGFCCMEFKKKIFDLWLLIH